MATILREWRHPTVGVSEKPVSEGVPSDISIQTGPLRDALERANVTTARSVVAVTDDEMANIEASLMVRSLNPYCNLVFRTADQQFAKGVASLIPASIGVGDYAIAAEAIVAAAFGENILGAFHLDGQSMIVAEYAVEPGDTLIDRLLAEIAFGYDVVPIVHRRGGEIRPIPSDDVRLEVDDRIVLIATIDGLQRVETAQRIPPDWFLWIERSPSLDATFEASNVIARTSGCDLRLARETMARIPTRLEVPLYQHQGLRLVRELKKTLVASRLEPAEATTPTSLASPRAHGNRI